MSNRTQDRAVTVRPTADLSQAVNEGHPGDTGEDTAPQNAPPPDLASSEFYHNRELSHLQFNLRVLAESKNRANPLLERLTFLLIFSSNLDEFYEIRVSGLKKQLESGRQKQGPDGRYPDQVLKQIHRISRAALEDQYRILNDDLLPSLRAEGICILNRDEWDQRLKSWANDYFHNEVLPVISPLGLDPAHPFPRLVNKSLNFILSLEGKDAFGRDSGLAIVPAPRSLPRLIKIPREIISEGDNFVFLSSIIHDSVAELFPGMQVRECHQFRVTRNADLEMTNVETEDVATALQGELPGRRFGAATKLEVASECPEELTGFLLDRFNLTGEELFRLDGPVNLQRMMTIRGMVDRPHLCFPKFSPGVPACLEEDSCIFSAVSQEDQLLLHPFQSFVPVIDWVRQAARDPAVLSIKQTLYRTNESSELVEALAEAARNGKEVTVVIELRARFDEEENIQFASVLQEAGAVVVYGVMGYKTHAKMLLIVRRENGSPKYYAHLGTGNYHRKNSQIYTDYSLMTCDRTLCGDTHKVFQQITGMGKKISPDALLHAPFKLKKSLLKMIRQEKEFALKGKPARIIAKVNGLTEPEIIQALYEASNAGVRIDLIVRGVCCLRPGVPGVSENIRVTSVVGRFLEHSRVYYFHNNSPQVYCASADWMERNLINRIEVCFPILRKKLATRIMEELDMYLEDRVQSWLLQADGEYLKLVPEQSDKSESVQILLLKKLSQNYESA
ncbi:MAG: polyphosphate kinase 1 [Gammaproteobacteria bacterium]|nr:polyphosphate kinase 1 [Pseudomonadales bacterium]MCP5345753.1 polyphosphate kinase 1 [Pseudomonadales bacterium]